MLTIWRADFDGDNKQLQKLDRKLKDLSKKHGISVEGPYLGQTTTLVYVMNGPITKLNAGGPEFLAWAQKEGVPITPVSFEIAQTPEEFGWTV